MCEETAAGAAKLFSLLAAAAVGASPAVGLKHIVLPLARRIASETESDLELQCSKAEAVRKSNLSSRLAVFRLSAFGVVVD